MRVQYLKWMNKILKCLILHCLHLKITTTTTINVNAKNKKIVSSIKYVCGKCNTVSNWLKKIYDTY